MLQTEDVEGIKNISCSVAFFLNHAVYEITKHI